MGKMTWEGLGMFVESNGSYLGKSYMKMGGHLFCVPWISIYVKKRKRKKKPPLPQEKV